MTSTPIPGGAPRRLAEIAFAMMPQALALVSAEGKVHYTSPAFDEIFPPQVATPDVDEILRRLLSTGEAEGQFRFERAGQTYRATPTRSNDLGAPLTLWVVDDITAEASAQKSRDEYLSMIVHDLRGPLAGIRGTLDFVIEDPEVTLPDLHQDLVKEARDESNRMMNLINEILDFASIRAGKFRSGSEKVNTAMLVRRAALSVRSLASREGISVEFDIPRTVPPVAGNFEKLLQVLNNLLVNAFKFTPGGGVVLVAAESRTTPSGEPRVVLSVTDTGPGIPLEKQDELFQRFGEVGTSTDKDIAGTGLGLFITKAIIEAFGGTVGFTSIPGVGTSFVVDLPVWESSEGSETDRFRSA